MAATLTNKENNVSTSTPTNTGSISWTAGTRGLVSVAKAVESGVNPTTGDVTVTGGNVTWNEIGFVRYEDATGRRGLYLFLSDDTPDAGALAINHNTGTFQEYQYSVDELAGFDGADIHQTVVTGATPFTGGASSLTLTDLGTIDTGDLVVAVFGFEDDADNLAPATGLTTHVLRQGGANVRSLLVGTSTTDDTPGVTWDTAGNASGGIGLIVNAADGGGGGRTTKNTRSHPLGIGLGLRRGIGGRW